MSAREGAARRSVSPTVASDGEAWACASCGHRLGPSSEAWRLGARRHERPLRTLGDPWATATDGGEVLLRHFYCPGCAILLDTETATAGEPPLDDRLL